MSESAYCDFCGLTGELVERLELLQQLRGFETVLQDPTIGANFTHELEGCESLCDVLETEIDRQLSLKLSLSMLQELLSSASVSDPSTKVDFDSNGACTPFTLDRARSPVPADIYPKVAPPSDVIVECSDGALESELHAPRVVDTNHVDRESILAKAEPAPEWQRTFSINVLPKVTAEYFESLERFQRKGITLMALNQFVSLINSFVTQKYTVLSCPPEQLGSSALSRRHRWLRESIPGDQGQSLASVTTVFTDQDLADIGARWDITSKRMLNALRSLGMLERRPGSGFTRYIVSGDVCNIDPNQFEPTDIVDFELV